MKNQALSHILFLNLGMLCISTSGALGRYIELPPPLTIWYRSLFALLFLGLFCYFKKYKFSFDLKQHGFTILLTGIFMTIHWVTYFYALQWSNVAIAMLALFTYPIITTLLEPIFLKTKFDPFNIFSAVIILLGIYFLAPSFDINNTMTQGLLIGLFSSFSYALRNVILKKKVADFNGSTLMFYQMMIMAIILIPVAFIYKIDFPTVQNKIPYIIFLGLITTAVGHTLFLNSFKHFSISTASIISGMQPIYGIIIAMIFLGEFPEGKSLIGGALILFTVVLESFRSLKNK